MRKIFFSWLRTVLLSTSLLFLAAIGENLVGADGNGANFFAVTGILSDHLRGNIGFINDFLYPLAHSNGIGRQDQGCTLNIGHGC